MKKIEVNENFDFDVLKGIKSLGVSNTDEDYNVDVLLIAEDHTKLHTIFSKTKCSKLIINDSCYINDMPAQFKGRIETLEVRGSVSQNEISKFKQLRVLNARYMYNIDLDKLSVLSLSVDECFSIKGGETNTTIQFLHIGKCSTMKGAKLNNARISVEDIKQNTTIDAECELRAISGYLKKAYTAESHIEYVVDLISYFAKLGLDINNVFGPTYTASFSFKKQFADLNTNLAKYGVSAPINKTVDLVQILHNLKLKKLSKILLDYTGSDNYFKVKEKFKQKLGIEISNITVKSYMNLTKGTALSIDKIIAAPISSEDDDEIIDYCKNTINLLCRYSGLSEEDEVHLLDKPLQSFEDINFANLIHLLLANNIIPFE